jgi:hypothetical protein
MRKIIFALVVLTTSLLCIPVFSQIDNEPVALGLPGDNLNLYAVLDVFQKSATLEEFERTLNDKKNNINNLDLNNDNAIDYIEVVGNKKGNSFSVVLRVAINSSEYQDVAVIEGYKNNAGKVIVQIVGDEDLYGKDYIVEPSFSETQNPGYTGNQKVIVTENNVYYGNDWPIVSYLFSPVFSIYVSPWHWGFYPSYWNPWAPVFFDIYLGFNSRYHHNNFYRRSSYIRYPVNHSYYFNRRQSSPIVREHRLEGRYNDIYNGRIYRRPIAPETRIIPPIIRQQSQPRLPFATHQPMRQNAPSVPQQLRPQMPFGTHPPMRQNAPVTPQQSRSQVPSGTHQPMRQNAPSAPRPPANPAPVKPDRWIGTNRR